MSPPKPREHGTVTGYKQHVKRSETPCQPCRDANAAMMREHRQGNKTYQAANAARHRALERLAREYPERFQEIHAAERAFIYMPDDAIRQLAALDGAGAR